MEQLIKELEPKLKLLETKYDKEIIELHVEYGDKNECCSAVGTA